MHKLMNRRTVRAATTVGTFAAILATAGEWKSFR
jgi:hypothetical protein